MSFNKVFILGNLGANPDVKYMPNGKKVAVISVATSRFVKNKDNNSYESKTEWHRIVLYDNLAEVASNFLRKGLKVFVEGYLKNNKWKDDNGIMHYSYDIIANEVKFLSAKDNNVSNSEIENVTKNVIQEGNADSNFTV